MTTFESFQPENAYFSHDTLRKKKRFQKKKTKKKKISEKKTKKKNM